MPNTPPPALELRGLRKVYRDFVAVDRIELAVPPGTIFGLLGPNGAGKTTTIRMLMDITPPDEGEVLIHGRPRTPDDRGRIGYLPEERGLYRKMTTQDLLLFLAELHGLRRADALGRIDGWLERVGLASWAKRKVEELSKGMQQKIQLIGTVLHEPDLLVLDEPFSGLDPINQGLFKDLLADYKRAGKTILFSTHIMEQAEKLCDHICLISGGRTVLAGPLGEIKRRFGGHSYRLVADGDLAFVSDLPGVRHAVDQDGYTRLMLDDDAEGAALLHAIVERTRVHEFRSEEPELEEIFIATIESSREGATDARGREAANDAG